MAFCTKCGKQIPDGQILCDQCVAQQSSSNSAQWTGKEETYRFHPMDIQNNKIMAVLSYIGILVLVPIFAAKNSPYARYHANQGLLLLLAGVIWGMFYSIVAVCLTILSLFIPFLWMISFAVISILGILSLVFLALAIYGIVNAATGKAKPLPVLGRFTLLH